MSSMRVRLREIRDLSPTLKKFVFEAPDCGLLPAASAGAHILITVRGPTRTWRNAYSLVSLPGACRSYEIIVRRVAASRGGSAFLHEQARSGDLLDIAGPTNLFPLSSAAKRHLLISGGIGLTPLLSYLPVLRNSGASFELHHVCRPEDHEPFSRLLAPFACDRVTIYNSRAALDLDSILGRQAIGTHLHVCGPRSLMSAATERAKALGWPAASIHTESFGDHTGGAPLTVVAARSGRTLVVRSEQSILEALEEAGIAAPFLCRGGVCGACATTVVAGEPEHRDDFLNESDRCANRVMMVCVSRARTANLVLDI